MSYHDLELNLDDGHGFGLTMIEFEWDHGAQKGLIRKCHAVRIVAGKRVLHDYAPWQIVELQDSLQDDMLFRMREDEELRREAA